MERIGSLLTSLGNRGAVANARRACEERRFAEQRLEAQLRRVAAPAVTEPAPAAWPVVAVSA